MDLEKKVNPNVIIYFYMLKLMIKCVKKHELL